MKRRKAGKSTKAPQSGPKSAQTATFAFDQHNEVRAIARERVGAVKPSQTILHKSDRKKPKHKKPLEADLD